MTSRSLTDIQQLFRTSNQYINNSNCNSPVAYSSSNKKNNNNKRGESLLDYIQDNDDDGGNNWGEEDGDLGEIEEENSEQNQEIDNNNFMNQIMNNNNTDNITISNTSSISPAVLECMRISNETTSKKTSTNKQTNNNNTGGNTDNTPVAASRTIPLDDLYSIVNKQRLSKIAAQYESNDSSSEEGEEIEEEDDRATSIKKLQSLLASLRIDEDISTDPVSNNNNNAVISLSSLLTSLQVEDDTATRIRLSTNKTKGSNNSGSSSQNSHDSHDSQNSSSSSGCCGGHNKKNNKIITTTSKKRKQHTSIKDECFLCAWGNEFHDGIRIPHINRLFQIIHECYGRMKNQDLARALHLYFKKNIYKKGDMQMLEEYVIIEHLQGFHSLNALNFMIESINEWKSIKVIAKNSLCTEDGKMDLKMFGIFKEAQGKLEKLYNMNIEKMNFNQGTTIDYLNSKGSYMNIMPLFSQREDEKKRIKRKKIPIKSSMNSFDA